MRTQTLGRRFAVAALALTAVLVPAVPGHAAPEPVHRTTFWNGGEFDIRITRGTSSHCGPDTLGDNWQCTEDYVNNVVEYSGRAPSICCSVTYQSMTLELRMVIGSTSTVISNYTGSCSPGGGWCTSFKSAPTIAAPWPLWQGRLGGYLQGRLILNYTEWDGTPRVWDSGTYGLDRTLYPILTAAEIVNQSPWASVFLVTGYRRAAPVDVQSIIFGLHDQEGHNFERTWGSVTKPDGTVVPFELPKVKAVKTSVGLAEAYLATPPMVMDQNGTYTLRVRSMDSSGTATALGAETVYPFTYVWNSAPTVPVLEEPANGTTFRFGQPVTFAVRSTDGEFDAYTPNVVVTGASGTFTATGVPTQSGDQAHAVIAGLAAGTYTWQATATDVYGATSGASATGTFTVQ